MLAAEGRAEEVKETAVPAHQGSMKGGLVVDRDGVKCGVEVADGHGAGGRIFVGLATGQKRPAAGYGKAVFRRVDVDPFTRSGGVGVFGFDLSRRFVFHRTRVRVYVG